MKIQRPCEPIRNPKPIPVESQGGRVAVRNVPVPSGSRLCLAPGRRALMQNPSQRQPQKRGQRQAPSDRSAGSNRRRRTCGLSNPGKSGAPFNSPPPRPPCPPPPNRRARPLLAAAPPPTTATAVVEALRLGIGVLRPRPGAKLLGRGDCQNASRHG